MSTGAAAGATARFHPRRVARKIAGREADEKIARLTERVDRLASRLKETEKLAELHRRELMRIAPQLSALEAKTERMRQLLEEPPAADATEVREARGLVASIQDEHRRMRARMTALTEYEERLRRLEEDAGLPHV